ncbi:MAG: lipoyl(octanoyl) transferase LipB [Spirochaetaceae bacterium]
MQLDIIHMGRVEYKRALEYQYELLDKRGRDEIPDTLLLLEHNPVVTLGKRGKDTDMLIPEAQLRERGVEIARIDRGGQATYHGPGQLVGYMIINLHNHQRKIKKFVKNIESFLITLLGEYYGISASTEDEHVGVWVGNRKIAAIGISIHNAITMHGFALNVSTDLDYFSLIVPCGIQDRGVTSIERETERTVSLEEVMDKAGEVFPKVFGYDGTTVEKRAKEKERDE